LKGGGLQNMVYIPRPILGAKIEQKLADLIVEMFKRNLHPAFAWGGSKHFNLLNSIEAFSAEDAKR
jgi:hypothetical protein